MRSIQPFPKREGMARLAFSTNCFSMVFDVLNVAIMQIQNYTAMGRGSMIACSDSLTSINPQAKHQASSAKW
jgi:hypothetical protein